MGAVVRGLAKSWICYYKVVNRKLHLSAMIERMGKGQYSSGHRKRVTQGSLYQERKVRMFLSSANYGKGDGPSQSVGQARSLVSMLRVVSWSL